MATKLSIQTFDNVPGGSQLDLAPYEIPDQQARIVLDSFVRPPNTLVKRGPVRRAVLEDETQLPTFPLKKIRHMFSTVGPSGVEQMALLAYSPSAQQVSIYSHVANLPGSVSNNLILAGMGDATEIQYYNSASTIDGGTVVGVASSLNENTLNKSYTGFWRGAVLQQYFATGAAFTRGSATVTIASGASVNIQPGMFMTAHVEGDNTWTPVVGIVKAVTNDTTVILEAPALYSKGASDGIASFQPIIGFTAKIVNGYITTSTTTSIVVGAGTKFKTQLVNIVDPLTGYTSAYDLYRREDMKWIGSVASTTNEETLTLSANASIDMQDEEYIAINRHVFSSVTESVSELSTTGKIGAIGFLSCIYADRQWYANIPAPTTIQDQWTNRLWFSDIGDPMTVDTTVTDGTFVNINSTKGANLPIVGIEPFRNNLLIFKPNEVIKLSGSNPNQFNSKPFFDDGAFNPDAITHYEDTIIWAGKKGIYGYDGANVINLIRDSISKYWQRAAESLDDPCSVRLAVYRNWLLISAENLLPPAQIFKDTEHIDVGPLTIVIDLKTRAVSFFTNTHFWGSVTSSRYSPYSFFGLYVDSDNSSYIASFADLFDPSFKNLTQVIDSLKTSTDSMIGPMAYIETKKYSASQFLQKKRWKIMLLSYLTSSTIKVDLVPGVETDKSASQVKDFLSTVPNVTWEELGLQYASWGALAAAFPNWSSILGTTEPLVKRNRFMEPNHFLSLRIYEEDPTSPVFQILNWGLGYKFYRPGRV